MNEDLSLEPYNEKKVVFRRSPKKRRLSHRKIVETFIKNRYHITNTCKSLKISPETWYAWQEKYPDLKQQLVYAKDSIKDDIERALLGKAREGDTQLLLYLAKTLLKDRGYGSENQSNQNTNTQVNIVLPEDTSKKYEWWGSHTKPDDTK